MTIGAGGRNSRLARAVQAPAYEVTPSLTCWYFSYWSDVQDAGLEMHLRDSRVVFAFPTNDSLFAVFVGWSRGEFPSVRADIEREFLAVIDPNPFLAERLRNGHREERFRGATDVPNFLRKPYGPGWALVGDAGCHKDPFLALGICDAFRDAELLADALDDGLAGRRPMPEAMEDYERLRNEATLPDYQQNVQLAHLQPPPADIFHLRAVLRGNQKDTNQFFLANEGMIPPEHFFNPENLQRIFAIGQTPPAA